MGWGGKDSLLNRIKQEGRDHYYHITTKGVALCDQDNHREV